MDDLGMEADVEGIDLPEALPGEVFVGFVAAGLSELDGVFVVSEAAKERVAEVRTDLFEIAFTLPVDQVSRMDQVLHMLLGPGEGVGEGFFLPAAEGAGPALLDVELVGLIGPDGGQVGIGQMQDGEGFGETDVDHGIAEREALFPASFGKYLRLVFGPQG